jgi:YkoY family integral membrane protein
MFDQTFRAGDMGTVAFLVLLEALLSADNALVLAILVRHLPKDQQKKALMYGLGGAFALRTVAILLAAYIIGFWWLQLVGALYLLFLPIKHFVDVARGSHGPEGKKMGFWATVVYLNLVDTAFALDSVIVAVAVVDTVKHPDKLWVVIAGAIIGIVILRFAAAFFIRILERYPILDHVAYLLVGWAGIKLVFISGHSFSIWYEAKYKTSLGFEIPEMPAWLFWSGMAIIAVGGTLYAVRHGRPLPEEGEAEADLVEDVMDHQLFEDAEDDEERNAPKSE